MAVAKLRSSPSVTRKIAPATPSSNARINQSLAYVKKIHYPHSSLPGNLFPGIKGMFRTVKKPKTDFMITNNDVKQKNEFLITNGDVKQVGKRKKAPLVRKRPTLVIKRDGKGLANSTVYTSTPQSINSSL